jgi:parallel beta-helix repeat protein
MRLFNFNKCLAVGVIILLAGGGFMLLGQYPSPSCPVYNVTDNTCFQTIQAAIDSASSGDLIKLYSTTFYENITIDVAVILEGYHMFSTSIQGDCNDDVVTITAAGVTIKSLGISGCGDNNTIYHGIKIESANNTIADTMIAECYRGVYTSGYSGNIIRNNLISTTYDYYEGIIVSGSNNKIYGNTIIRAVTTPRVGLAITVLSGNNDIYQNSIANHEYAFYIFAASDNNIFANTIQNNDYGIYLFSNGVNNKIHHNNFLNNTTQAYTYYSGSNQWDNGCPSGGNYWSNNTNCTDASDCDAQQSPDGICDSAFAVPYTGGTANYDSYPLTAQWSSMCGNVDGSPDYVINWDDCYYLIDYIYNDGPIPVPPCAADLNCSGTISLSDVSILINYLNNGTPLNGCCCQ